MYADVTIIGAGIVGLCTAYQLSSAFPSLKIVLLEKESGPARHQSGRNSGVIHSGIYYRPGSLKANLCKASRKELISFCDKHGISYELCGKIILATEESEFSEFETLLARGNLNRINCRELSGEELKEREPYARSGRAILVEDAGIVDYRSTCEMLAKIITKRGGALLYRSPLVCVKEGSNSLTLTTGSGEVETGRLINCAGLFSDRIARLCGVKSDIRIIPFRGEYYKLKASAPRYCSNLIYPVPDPRFPFLGVHLTRMVSGEIECGPNAVLALAREGYSWRDVNFADVYETLSYGGFWRLSRKYWKTGLKESLQSVSKTQFNRSLQKLVPGIKSSELLRAGSGVRAQAVTPEGKLADDFIIEEGERSTHVLNAPSPAATSAFEIGRYIAERQRPFLES